MSSTMLATLVFRQSLSLNLKLSRLTRLASQKTLASSQSSHLYLLALELLVKDTKLNFHADSEASNPGTCACITRALPTGKSSQGLI